MANRPRAPPSWGVPIDLMDLSPAGSYVYEYQSPGITDEDRGDEQYTVALNSRANTKNLKPDIIPVGRPPSSFTPLGLSTVPSVPSPQRRQLPSSWTSGDSKHGEQTQLHLKEDKSMLPKPEFAFDHNANRIADRQLATPPGQHENNRNQVREQWRQRQQWRQEQEKYEASIKQLTYDRDEAIRTKSTETGDLQRQNNYLKQYLFENRRTSTKEREDLETSEEPPSLPHDNECKTFASEERTSPHGVLSGQAVPLGKSSKAEGPFPQVLHAVAKGILRTHSCDTDSDLVATYAGSRRSR